MTAKTIAELPPEVRCRLCDHIKRLCDMIVVHHRATGLYYVRPRCKGCNNARERGHRREWKRRYQQRWRRRNADLNRSYWKNRQAQMTAYAYRHFLANHHALLIQGRLRRHGTKVSLDEARDLLKRYGRCYPSRLGLTPEGRRECERIRSRLRWNGIKTSTLEIRMQVYEDGFYITPKRQPVPYKQAAKTLRQWQKKHKEEKCG